MNVSCIPNRALVTEAPDVFIAGAGPAGLACAIAAALQGLQVTIADGMKPPIDTACGEGLMPDALATLSELGITLNSTGPTESALLRGIRFIDDATPCGRPAKTEAAFPEAPGRGIRRTLLHQLLLDRAAALGVQFHWQTVVRRIDGPQIHTNQRTFRARWIVGADGPQSRIRACAGLDKASISSRRIGLRQHFAITPWTDFVEVYWTNRAQAYVTPISSGEICIAFVATEKFASIQQALSLFPTLKLRLAFAPPTDTPLGSITLTRRLHRVTSGNIALIGDASGSVDAVTGEGLALCFRQALALAQALKAENLEAYEHAHRKIHRIPRLMSRTMLLMDTYPIVRSRTLSTFQLRPALFSHLLHVHIGHTQVRLPGAIGLLASVLCFLGN
ncbi:MAG TPA: FAD-dependent monooxygenase [Edaphobacter sp.]